MTRALVLIVEVFDIALVAALVPLQQTHNLALDVPNMLRVVDASEAIDSVGKGPAPRR